MSDIIIITTPYSADEAETLHRCNEGKPVSDSALLQLTGAEVRLLEEEIEAVAELATPITNDPEFWAVMNDLRVHICACQLRLERRSPAGNAALD
jgi:hypothetical protein